MSKGKDKPLKFEEAIAELESIIEQIESGQCGLEECIAQYEKGMKLVGRCQAILNVVQQRIVELAAEGDKLQSVPSQGLTPQALPDQDGREDDPDQVDAELDDQPQAGE